MKRILSIVSLMLLVFVGSASAQFPGGWGQPQKPAKPISQDPSIRAPKAEVGNYTNKLRQVSSSMTYDFNSETCKFTLICLDKLENKEMRITMDYADDYAAFAKWVNGLCKESEKMLKKATDENSRVRIALPKSNLRGSIRENASENKAPNMGSMGLSCDAHFNVIDGIATWELKFSQQRGGFGGGFGGFGGFGGNPGGQQANQAPAPSFMWVFYNLDEFKKLQEVTDKATLKAINKVLLTQGKEMEANYNK